MNRFNRVRGVTRRGMVVAVLAGTALSSVAEASNVAWINFAGGSAGVGANWQNGQLPTAIDDATFGLNNNYLVTFPASVASTNRLTFASNGSPRLRFDAPHTTNNVFVAVDGSTTPDVSFVGGVLTVTNKVSVAFGPTTASLTLANGTTLQTTSESNGLLAVGETGTGTLTIRDGSRVLINDAVVTATANLRTGTINVSGRNDDGPSTLQTLSSVRGDITLGNLAAGVLNVSDNGVVIAGRDMILGKVAGSTGTAAFAPTAGLTVGRNLEIAHNATAVASGNASMSFDNATATVTGATNLGDAEGGTGALSITNNSSFSTGTAFTQLAGSGLTIANSTVTVGGTATLNGTTTMTNGTLVASSILGANSTNITASGRIDAPISTSTSAAATLTLIGSLDVGPSVIAGGFSWSGPINVGPHALSVRMLQGNLSRVGDCSLGGGSLNMITPGRSFLIANGDSLTGFGTVNAPFSVNTAAPVTATGPGLRFNGLVTANVSPNLTMTGSRVTFAGGGLMAAGDISAETFSLAGAPITATGPLSLGKAASFLGLDIGGDLSVGAHTVSLRSAGFSTLRGTTTLAGGAINSLGEVLNLGTLQGVGSVNHQVINTFPASHIAPGGPATIGALHVRDLRQGDADTGGGHLDIDIAGTIPGQIDFLESGNTALLGGTLTVTALPSVDYSSAFALPFINTEEPISGTFNILNLPTAPRGGFHVIYGSTQVILVYCPADTNVDGELNPDDLADFIGCFFAQPPCATADFNTDGESNPDDLADYIGSFFSGCE